MKSNKQGTSQQKKWSWRRQKEQSHGKQNENQNQDEKQKRTREIENENEKKHEPKTNAQELGRNLETKSEQKQDGQLSQVQDQRECTEDHRRSESSLRDGPATAETNRDVQHKRIRDIEHRVKGLGKEADVLYGTRQDNKALPMYQTILNLTRELCEKDKTYVDDKKRALYQKIVATAHYRIGMMSESLGDNKAAMDSYCMALLQYKIIIDSRSREMDENLSYVDEQSSTDKLDERMGAILTKMATIQLHSGNLAFAQELNGDALSLFKTLRMRKFAKTEEDDDTLTQSELEDKIIHLLNQLGEICSALGDRKASKEAFAEAFRLQKRKADRSKSTQSRARQRHQEMQKRRQLSRDEAKTSGVRHRGNINFVNEKEVATWRHISSVGSNVSTDSFVFAQRKSKDVNDGRSSGSSNGTDFVDSIVQAAGVQVNVLASSSKKISF